MTPIEAMANEVAVPTSICRHGLGCRECPIVFSFIVFMEKHLTRGSVAGFTVSLLEESGGRFQ
jgi:hypothetical protein